MLTLPPSTEPTKRNNNNLGREILSVAMITTLILGGCQSANGGNKTLLKSETESTNSSSKPEITNPALKLMIEGANPEIISTSIYIHNPLNLPKLRGPIRDFPTNTYSNQGNLFIESTRDAIESIQVYPIGPGEITIGKKNIIEIRIED